MIRALKQRRHFFSRRFYSTKLIEKSSIGVQPDPGKNPSSVGEGNSGVSVVNFFLCNFGRGTVLTESASLCSFLASLSGLFQYVRMWPGTCPREERIHSTGLWSFSQMLDTAGKASDNHELV
jgi:hypothetical protein